MPKATNVTVLAEEGGTTSDGSHPKKSNEPVVENNKLTHKREKKKSKTTPLPLRQLVPMIFVLLNESLCRTMLLPFVGYLVAFLQNRSPDDAGYYSGIMVGVFSFGQILSARLWGKTSDKYGRRFPLISGLFMSGLMMLGFGLSGSIWGCAIFRFLHGFFNGNVLVAKTMMAEITDKTNQAKGFAFLSFCSGIGFLIGPLIGATLYDPSSPDSTLSFLHMSTTGLFARRPALLPSLFIFLYTSVGMTMCTFFVQESNPHAQPLPRLVTLLFPCMWVEAKPFVHTPMAEDSEEEEDDSGAASGMDDRANDKDGDERRGGHSGDGDSGHCGDDEHDEHSDEHVHPLDRESCTFPVGALGIASPVAIEDTRQFDRLMEERWERLRETGNVSHSESVASLATSTASSRRTRAACRGVRDAQLRASLGDEPATDPAGEGCREEREGCVANKRSTERGDTPCSHPDNSECVVRVREEPRSAPHTRKKGSAREDEGSDALVEVLPVDLGTESDIHAEAPDAVATAEPPKKVKSFGYREAFSRPITRFMLITYMTISASDMAVKQCFPLWAISSIDKGGLGFTPANVSYVLLFNSVPSLASNYFFAKACARYSNKIGLFRLGVVFAGCASITLPLNAYLPFHIAQYLGVVLCTASQQFFSSWCYGLITMLTARSAPPGQIGTIMGINQSCGGLSRTIIPIIAAPLYAWSINNDHPFPFNHVFVFFCAGLSFTYCWWRSYQIRTVRGTDLEIVTGNAANGPECLQSGIQFIKDRCGCAGDDAGDGDDGHGRQRPHRTTDVVVVNG